MWNDLGLPPQAAEIEVTLMGPGFGESVVVHFGNGEWMMVDSCIDRSDAARHPAGLKYLRALGVNVASAVKLVVVSHWDDDHVQGIAEVVAACTSAQFCASTAITGREFDRYVESVSLGATATAGGNVSNLRRVLELLRARDQAVKVATPGRRLHSGPNITSWSPSDHEAMLFLQFIAHSMPQAGQTLRKVVPGSPNLTSIVLSIDREDESILLGGDMEFHLDKRRGWGAIVTEAEGIGFVKGNLVKIPHHGSHTGHDDRMWSNLLKPTPISVIAPFGRGAIEKRPPKSEDVRRINRLSSKTFITAPRAIDKVRKMDRAVSRSLREGNIHFNGRTPLGIVQLRRLPGSAWQHTLFGSAIRTK